METDDNRKVTQKEACKILGVSVNTFRFKIKPTELFQRNVPDKTPDERTITYSYHDVVRFSKFSNWY